MKIYQNRPYGPVILGGFMKKLSIFTLAMLTLTSTMTQSMMGRFARFFSNRKPTMTQSMMKCFGIQVLDEKAINDLFNSFLQRPYLMNRAAITYVFGRLQAEEFKKIRIAVARLLIETNKTEAEFEKIHKSLDRTIDYICEQSKKQGRLSKTNAATFIKDLKADQRIVAEEEETYERLRNRELEIRIMSLIKKMTEGLIK